MLDMHPGRVALVHVAKVLAQKPKKDDEQLSRVTECLGRFRHDLIARSRSGAATDDDRRRLSHLNAILALVMGMHFPLGDAPWDEFEKAEAWLAELVDELEPGNGRV